MRETWMRPNTRVLWFSLALVGLLLGLGLNAALWLPRQGLGLGGRIAGGCLVLFSLIAAWRIVASLRSPRLAYDQGHLLVNLGARGPIRVPIHIVECFFLGQGPSLLPQPGIHRGAACEQGGSETATVVVRLAERATHGAHRDVKAALGCWCDGYITIRGTWSEPISGDLVSRLNARLVEKQRDQRPQAPQQEARADDSIAGQRS